MGATKLMTAAGGGITLDTASTATDKTITIPADNGTMALTSQLNGFRNRIINGAMMIDQRNAGASVTIANGGSSYVYTVDRWSAFSTQNSKISVQQNAGSVTPPAGFTNYLGVTALAATTVASGDIMVLKQAIEANNTADFGIGAAGASSFTISFWVRSSLTGTFGGSINNIGITYACPFTFAISSANTWEYKTVTFTGPVAGTWQTGTGASLQLILNLGTGSTYVGGTSGTWAAQTVFAPSGTVNMAATNGATFYITGVQLEKGTVATGFDYRPYGTELALCQRYYEILISSGTGMNLFPETASFARNSFPYKITKRTNATISGGTGGAEGGGTWSPSYGGYTETWTISAYYGASLIRPTISGPVVASAEL